MSKWRDIFLKAETKKSWEQLTRRTTAPQVIEQLIQEQKSPYPPRFIAQNSNTGKVFITETDREDSTHILGTTKQGKSKFLEMQMSMDIWMLQKLENYNAGFLFIDSTELGGTMYKVLKYCIKNGFEKVLVIDPHHIQEFGYVVPINPLHYNAPSEAMTSHIVDSLRVLWNTKDFKEEAIITKYAPYFIEALHHGLYTIPDIESFIVPSLRNQREQILAKEREGRPLRYIAQRELERIYTEKAVWLDVQPTLRRFEPFRHSVMKQMLGCREGLDFGRLIKDGWIILCNLHPDGVYDEPQQKLLGTTLINEVVRAKQRMKGYSVPFHIYIDEFGLYATRKISDILYYARHLHLYITLAHHSYSQVPDDVASAVDTGAKNKILFYTLNHDDLMRMIRMMYGGDIEDRQAKHVLTQLKKQQAALKIGKRPTQICDLRDWPDPNVSDKQVQDFLLHLFNTNPEHYRPKGEVWEEIKNRFVVSSSPAGTPERPVRAKQTSADKARPARSNKQKATVGDQGAKRSEQPDTGSPQGGSVFDDIANRADVLRDKKGRQAGKRNSPPPKAE